MIHGKIHLILSKKGNTMATITFDTHKFIKRFKSAGFDETQAEALSDAQKESLKEALDTSLATRGDISRIEKELTEIKAEQKIMKWMMGFVLAGIAALILKSFFT